MKEVNGVISLVDSMAGIMGSGNELFNHDVEELFRENILERPEADEELVSLLPSLIPRGPKDELRINAALDILAWLLGELRLECERRGKGAAARMERLQSSLARHVFCPDGDAGLCAAVGRTLLESRVEILAPIQEATRLRMTTGADGVTEIEPSDIAEILGEGLLELGIADPFDALDHVLETIGLLEPDLQCVINGELLASAEPLLREMAPLMLFHPSGDVRSAVAELLSGTGGADISPVTLRRLIMVRSWFPPEVREGIDMAISSARRAGVECAPLAKKKVHFIYATTIDGGGAQSFWIATGGQRQVQLCNMLWRQGSGVLDAFIHRLPSVQAADRFMKGLPEMMCFTGVTQDYLDKAISCAIAAGSGHGGVPHRGLLRIAELAGSDGWKAAPFDAGRELSIMAAELGGKEGQGDAAAALEDSADWPSFHEFADTWFEDDEQTDRVVSKALKGKAKDREEKAVEKIMAEVLEPRRGIWLERLTLMALWLKCSDSPPIPWRDMFHLADALNGGVPMAKLPLMNTVAKITLAAAMERGGV